MILKHHLSFFFRIIILLLIYFLYNIVYAQTIITDETNKIDDFHLQYLYIEDSGITIDEIQTKNFTQTISNQFSMGYKDGSSWFKIDISNRGNKEEFILYFTEPIWTSLDIYRLDKNQSTLEKTSNKWVKEPNALNVPLKNRAIKDVNPAFLINIKPGETKTYFLEGKSVAAHIGEFQLFTIDEYYRPNRISITHFYIFYSAMLLIITIIVSLLFSMLKEKLYLFYLGYVISFIVWVSVLSGYYLSLGFSGWNEGLHATGAILIFFLVIFSSEVLQLKEYYPKINKLFYYSAGIIFLCSILITLKVPYVSLFFNLFSSFFFMLLLGVVISLLKNNSFKNLRFYFYALLIYMPSMGLMTLTFNSLIDNTDLTRYSFIVGSFCEILFFSFIIASKFNEIQQHKKLLQNELINQKIINEHDIETKIEQRTLELSKINEQLEKTKKILFEESITDKLSGLYNRRYFTEISSTLFNSSLRSNKALSALMLDIDFFKKINDNYGHSAGDEVIITCANIFKEIARNSDIVTRYGGEEFIFLLPNTEIKKALNLAKRIKDTIANYKISINQKESIKITISIGATQINYDEDKNFAEIIKRADIALYTAKKMGRNRVESLM